ncbi:MAG: hypothetical protein IT374_07940 [Polyangiaceae bacterium]|nr:hypothetical protein [Polyangiaceae bacterium]
MDRLFTPDDLASMPTIEHRDAGAYDWATQGRVAPVGGPQKQTFNGRGQPMDSTTVGGQTLQTFDGRGQPTDSNRD